MCSSCDSAREEVIGSAQVRFVPFQPDPDIVANYYRAADVYLHAARVETFSLTIAEAMACGIPVVATAVGAVPERILCLDHPAAAPGYRRYGTDRATGVLVASGLGEAMAEATLTILADPRLSRELGANAAKLSSQAYRIERQTRANLDWFEDILSRRKSDR